MKRFLLILPLLLLPTLAQAQTHVCDQPLATSGTAVEGTGTLSFCVNPIDITGTPTRVISEALYVDGARFSITATPQGIPSAVSGKQDYSTGIILVKGTHEYRVAGITEDGKEGEKSPPFTLVVTPKAGAPVAPAIRGVKQP